MAKSATSLRGILVLTIILIVLGLLDMAGGVSAIGFALNAGWPQTALEGSTRLSGLIAVCLMGQALVRVMALPLDAWWTLKLVKRAHIHQAFPVSIRWAWLGWFVPVASYWLPCKAQLALNQRLGRAPWIRNMLVVTAWCVRLVTCPTGGVVGFFIVSFTYGFMIALGRGRATPNIIPLMIHWMVALAIISVLNAILHIIVMIMTYRNQPKPDEVRQAEIFG
jgi:hypothetical protein